MSSQSVSVTGYQSFLNYYTQVITVNQNHFYSSDLQTSSHQLPTQLDLLYTYFYLQSRVYPHTHTFNTLRTSCRKRFHPLVPRLLERFTLFVSEHKTLTKLVNLECILKLTALTIKVIVSWVDHILGVFEKIDFVLSEVLQK